MGAPVVVRRVNPDGTPTWEKAGTLVRLWWNHALGRYEAEVAYSEAPAIRFVYVLTPGATRWKAPAWGEAALVPVEEVERHVEPGADVTSDPIARPWATPPVVMIAGVCPRCSREAIGAAPRKAEAGRKLARGGRGKRGASR